MFTTLLLYSLIFAILPRFDLYAYFIPFHSLFGNIICYIIGFKIVCSIIVTIKELINIKHYFGTQRHMRKGRYTRLVQEVLLLSGNSQERAYDYYKKKKIKRLIESSWMIMYLVTGFIY